MSGASAVRTSSARYSPTWRALPANSRTPPSGSSKIAKPQRCQIEARGPSLRAIDEQLHALAGQTDPLTNDQLTRFVDRESQLPRADLREHPARPQTREADRRVRARRGNQARIRRQPLDRLGDRAHRSLAADRVQVVEHDRHPTAIRDEAIHQLIDRRLDRRTPDPEARKRATSRSPHRAARPPSPGASTTAPGRRRPSRA